MPNMHQFYPFVSLYPVFKRHEKPPIFLQKAHFLDALDFVIWLTKKPALQLNLKPILRFYPIFLSS